MIHHAIMCNGKPSVFLTYTRRLCQDPIETIYDLDFIFFVVELSLCILLVYVTQEILWCECRNNKTSKIVDFLCLIWIQLTFFPLLLSSQRWANCIKDLAVVLSLMPLLTQPGLELSTSELQGCNTDHWATTALHTLLTVIVRIKSLFSDQIFIVKMVSTAVEY